MLSTLKSKNDIYLEKVADQEWQVVYGKSLHSLMNRFDEACDAMDNGEYEEAIEKFQTIIDEAPEFIDAYNQLGLALTWSGLEEEWRLIMEEGINNALTLFPEDFFEKRHRLEWGWLNNRAFLRCYANLGLCYLEDKLFEKAKFIFERILVMNPNDNQGMRDPLLNCYFRLGKLEAALNLCNSYQEDILVGINYGRALVSYKLGNKQEAEKQFLAAMRFSPRVAKELVKSKHIKPKNYGKGTGIIVGGQEEAYEYWLSFGHLWQTTPGAILFVKNCIEKSKKIKIDVANSEED